MVSDVPVDAADERCGRGGKISPEQARALCGSAHWSGLVQVPGDASGPVLGWAHGN
jgi:hypothetical protein